MLKKLLRDEVRTNFILKLSYLFVVCLFLLDCFRYYGFVSNNLMSPWVVLALVVVGHLVVRWQQQLSLGEKFVQTQLLVMAPLLLGLFGLIFLAEEQGLLYPNYFFNNFKFHYHSLPALAVASAIMGLIHSSKTFWQRFGRSFFFISILISWGSFVVFYYAEPENYQTLVKEDNLVEYLTALLFLIAASISASFVSWREYLRIDWHRQLFVVGCVVAALGLFVVAGEEISWGQRLVGVETPEFIAESNRQGEINLHNSELLWPLVYGAYLLIGLYGSLTWIAVWLLKDYFPTFKQKFFPKLSQEFNFWPRLLIPEGYLVLNFSLIVLYVWLRSQHGPWKYQLWEELAELYLVLGLTLHLAVQRLLPPEQQKFVKITSLLNSARQWFINLTKQLNNKYDIN